MISCDCKTEIWAYASFSLFIQQMTGFRYLLKTWAYEMEKQRLPSLDMSQYEKGDRCLKQAQCQKRKRKKEKTGNQAIQINDSASHEIIKMKL